MFTSAIKSLPDMNLLEPLNYDLLCKEDLIGKGTFTHVYRAQYEGRPYALKIIDDPSCVRKNKKATAQANLMHLHPHWNIIQLHAVDFDRGFMLLEPAAATLYDILYKGLTLNGLDFRPFGYQLFVARDIFKGLHHLHSHGIVHQDIKPENVLFVSTTIRGWQRWVAKISDFGIQISDYPSRRGDLYLAPELIEFSGPVPACTPASDLYAAGITLNEYGTRKTPWEGEKLATQLVRNVCRDRKRPAPIIPHSHREGLYVQTVIGDADASNTCLNQDPAKRGSALTLFQTATEIYLDNV